nr:hypothetical protein CFP56_28636 [Quercus suber]
MAGRLGRSHGASKGVDLREPVLSGRHRRRGRAEPADGWGKKSKIAESKHGLASFPVARNDDEPFRFLGNATLQHPQCLFLGTFRVRILLSLPNPPRLIPDLEHSAEKGNCSVFADVATLEGHLIHCRSPRWVRRIMPTRGLVPSLGRQED